MGLKILNKRYRKQQEKQGIKVGYSEFRASPIKTLLTRLIPK
jgi:hypothetical protein